MTPTQLSIALHIASAFKAFAVDHNHDENAMSEFKDQVSGTSGLIDIQTYDDIHLCIFSFEQAQQPLILAVGDFNSDAYDVFANHEEVMLADGVAHWKPTSSHNPILNYVNRINEHPTVDLEQLYQAYRSGEFTCTPAEAKINDGKDRACFMVTGNADSIAANIGISVELIKGKKDTAEVDFLSTSIGGVSDDAFFIVEDGKEVNEGYAYVAAVELFDQINLKDIAAHRFN